MGLRVAISRRNVQLTTIVCGRGAPTKWRRLTLGLEVHTLQESLRAANTALKRSRAASASKRL